MLMLVALGSLAFAGDTIIVKKDSRLDVLTARQAAINKRATILSHNYKGPGFRVQVVSTNNRQMAYGIKSKLLQNFPNEKTYIIFQSPYFKVRIGNFTGKDAAESFLNDVQRVLSINAYIVRDNVEITPAGDDTNLQE